jgi:hypothetical protein
MNRHSILAIIGGLLIAALFVPIFRLTETRRFQEDEHIFVRRGIFADYYLSGNFTDPIWQSFDSFDVPKFAELFYGVVLQLHSGTTVRAYLESVPKFLNPTTTSDFLWPSIYSHEHCCTIQDLPMEIQQRLQPVLVARKAAVWFGLGILIILFVTSWRTAGWIFAVVSTAIIGHNALFQTSLSTAMGDGPLVFFSALYALSIGYYFSVEQAHPQRAQKYFIIAAVCAGLATATKLNGVINLIHFVISAVILLGWFRQPLKVFVAMVRFVVIAYATFLLLNPFLWADILKNTQIMYLSRLTTIAKQQENSVQHGQSLATIPLRIERVFERTLMPSAVYGNFSFSPVVLPTGLLLCTVGLIFLSLRIRHRPSQRILEKIVGSIRAVLRLDSSLQYREQLSYVLWLGSWLGITTLLIPLDWDHYYLPIVISISCIQAYGIVEGCRWLLAKFPTMLKLVPDQK